MVEMKPEILNYQDGLGSMLHERVKGVAEQGYTTYTGNPISIDHLSKLGIE